MQIPCWADDDPLADAFLVQFGAYPDAASIGIDYYEMLNQAALAIQLQIQRDRPLPVELHSQPNLSYLSRVLNQTDGTRRRSAGYRSPARPYKDGLNHLPESEH